MDVGNGEDIESVLKETKKRTTTYFPFIIIISTQFEPVDFYPKFGKFFTGSELFIT